MKTLRFFLFFFLALWITSCTKDFVNNQTEQSADATNGLKSASIGLKIAVMSDIHYLDPVLMKNGAASGLAFQNYLNSDPKLIEFSDPIFRKAVTEIIAEKPDILLIPGDITKDGEMVCHRTMAKLLKQVSDQGIKVFVIPGNHDINNPEAVAYNGNNSFTVPSVSASDFSQLYSQFGYKNAISRDEHSLSYVCQPFNNIWILGIDDCKYYLNVTGGLATVSGVIKDGTMHWIRDRLAEAKKKNITVLAMMHHGLVEHYVGQESLDPGYVTDNWEVNADVLIDAGLKVIFTGHYHANDVTMRTNGNNTVYDIETGSLVTPPSPYRIITLDPNWMNIDTKHITSIAATFPPGLQFVSYSRMFLSAHLDGIFTYMLSSPPYSVPSQYIGDIAPLFRNAFMAHYAGDEHITPKELLKVQGVSLLSPQLGMALQSLWSDLPPADNHLLINMRKK
ncbi:MAG: metallophosphoesterase [Mariniphaga sp.]